MVFTVLAAAISAIAVIFYIVDIVKHPQTICKMNSAHTCDEEYYATVWQRPLFPLLALTLYLSSSKIVMHEKPWEHVPFTFTCYKVHSEKTLILMCIFPLSFSQMFSVRVKLILLCLSIVQTAVSSSFAFIMYRERQIYHNYMVRAILKQMSVLIRDSAYFCYSYHRRLIQPCCIAGATCSKVHALVNL